MKAEGIEYDARMAELEKLEYPKPLREFIYHTFNEFAAQHPWVGDENIRPKSIAREMFETYQSFSDYIREYELQRSEGLLLRHLNSVYKVLAQTVPESAKTEEVREMELYLGTMIRQVDSSLLDAWERMQNPDYQGAESQELRPPGAEEAARDITRDAKAFTAALRNRIFTLLRALSLGEWEEALALLQEAAGGEPLDAEQETWTAERLKARMGQYLSDHLALRLDPEGRNSRHTYVEPEAGGRSWRLQQMLIDPEAHNDWVAEFQVDLEGSRRAGAPVMQLSRLGVLS